MPNVFHRAGSPTVDTMLGDTYDAIVKAASNLETIEEFNNNVDLETIKTELPTLKNISNNINTITATYDDIEAIKNAPLAAQEAKNTITTAKEESDAMYAKSIQVLNDTKETIQRAESAIDTVNQSQEAILICASNIDSINTTSESIDAINTVSAYLEDVNTDASMPIPDLGEVGSDTPDFSFDAKTPIEIIAAYIDSLLAIYNNLEELVKLADDATIPKLLQISSDIQDYLDQTKEQIDSINNTIELFDEKYAKLEDYYNSIVSEFNKLSEDIQNKKEEILTEIAEPVDSVLAAAEEVKEIKRQCAKNLVNIREVYKLTSEALDSALTKGLAEIRLVKDEAKRTISKTADAELDRVTVNLEVSVNEATEEFNSKVDELIKEKTEEFTETINSKLDQLDALIQKKIDELTEDFQAQIDAQVKIIKDEAAEIFTKLDDTYNSMYSNIVNTGEDILEDLNSKISNVYKYKGSVQSLDDLKALETSASPGDTYNVINENGNNYAWTGDKWDSIGSAFISDYGEIRG